VAQQRYDAVVVGAGPNGLAAAAVLAQAGRSVLVREARDDVGGGTRSAELTLPGFIHDVCSAVHPMGACSPAFAELGLERYGLEFLQPPVALGHPLEGGRAGIVYLDARATLDRLGADATAWERIVVALSERWDRLAPALLAPVLRVPRHPFVLARFGLPALVPSTVLARRLFVTDEARALFAGAAAHAFLPLNRPLTSAFGLVLLGAAHAVGWPVVKGGSQAIADALTARARELGVVIETGRPVGALGELPESDAVLFDLAPRQVAAIAGAALPDRYRSRLERFHHGPAAFKVDYALDGPVPWSNAECLQAGTLHLGGTLDEIAAAEAAVASGEVPERPYVLVSQPAVVDPSRAPEGQHTLWTYCHVPNGCTVDMTEAIERQIERFAPEFRDRVLARHVADPAWYERYNPAYVGGDITGGAHTGLQLLFRPTPQLRPYRTPNPRLYMCSASTPPGGGVHGMSGYHAAQAVLRAS
jgi:phytoene dehydrogenase-like protein